jgi:hypothetical protein
MIILLKDYIERDPGFLYEIITDGIDKGIKLVINFRNVDKLTSEFLDESIGRVLKENDFDNIKHKLNFINVEKEIRSQLVDIVNAIVE